MTRDQKSDLKELLKERSEEEKRENLARKSYVKELAREKEMDATQRESIEQKMQDRDDQEQALAEQRYQRAQNYRSREIARAHLEINENEEYDLHLPEKKDHNKLKSSRLRIKGDR